MKVLLTGGAGFIGHHVLKALLVADYEVTVIDRLDVSGNYNRIAEVARECKELGSRTDFSVQFHDLKAPFNDLLTKQVGVHDYILHLAAATHVDRSIEDPMAFVMDNVVATCNVLNFARQTGCKKFFNFSTDEVFGPAPPGVKYEEWDRYRSGNPYAATKAGAEELGLAFHNTYKVPVVTTHTMNVFGRRQHPEKFIPSTIRKVRDGDMVVVHASKDMVPGSRFYIDAGEVASALLFLMKHGEPGDKYNIVGECEVDNLELAQSIAQSVGMPLRHELVDFHSSRPGHDLRYALDGSKMETLGWKPKSGFGKSLDAVVAWTLRNAGTWLC
jgi:dTDP-glucose 4,6-dehydratase